MTKEMQVALNIEDRILILAGYVWCSECGCWWFKPDAKRLCKHGVKVAA